MREPGNSAWKICDHPVVIGLSRIFVTVGAPLIVAFVMWAAKTFDDMRIEFVNLRATINAEIVFLHQVDGDFARRLESLERSAR